MRTEKKCLICGKMFQYYTTPKKERYTCSIKCRGKYNKKIGLQPPRYEGKKHPSWKGGKGIDLNGYVRVYIAPYKRISEHRLVMEKHLKRKLTSKEHIHHIDGNKLNNKIENLLLVSNEKHQNIHHLGKFGKYNV